MAGATVISGSPSEETATIHILAACNPRALPSCPHAVGGSVPGSPTGPAGGDMGLVQAEDTHWVFAGLPFLFFFGCCTCGTWTFPGQGPNLHLTCTMAMTMPDP